jgi:hypothetical protein
MRNSDKIFWVIMAGIALFIACCCLHGCKTSKKQQFASDVGLHGQKDLQVDSAAATELHTQNAVIDSSVMNCWRELLQYSLYTVWSPPDSTGKQYITATNEQNITIRSGADEARLRKENTATSLVSDAGISVNKSEKLDFKSKISEKSETETKTSSWAGMIPILTGLALALYIAFRAMKEN